MSAIFTLLTWLASHTWDGIKQVAVTLKAAAIEVRGMLTVMLLMNVKQVVVLGLLWAVIFAALSLALRGVLALLGDIASWLPIVEHVQNLVPYSQGIFYAVWHSLCLSYFFTGLLQVMSAWFAGWTVYKTLEYSLVIRRFGILKGFWKVV